MDNVVRKCPLNYQSLQECIFNICNLLETYDMPEGARYLISLENTMYLMNKNCVPVDNSFIVETVTDYFLMNENENIDNTVRNIKYVIENSKFFNEEELSGVKYLCIDEQSVIDDLENEDDISPVEENKIHDMFCEFTNLQREVYELMFKNGWYSLEKAPSTKINEKYQMLNDELTSLNQYKMRL